MCKRVALGLNSIAIAEDFGGSEYSADTSSTYNPGIYLGAQLGMSNMHYGSKYTVSGNTVDNNKFAGRGYVGYAFSQYISTELGYDYFGRQSLNIQMAIPKIFCNKESI